MVSGKGGVGKTTFALALGMNAARRGLRVLFAQMKAFDGCRLLKRDDCSVARPIGPGSNLWTVNLDPQKSVEQFGTLRLKKQGLMRALLTNRATKAFIEAIPGLESLAMLGRTWYYTIEENGHGRLKFDLVLLEMPGLGHLTRLLRLPEIVLDSVPDGPLRNDAHQIASLLRDRQRSCIILVTMAEEMPVQETMELLNTLEEIEHRPEALVINGLYPDMLTKDRNMRLVMGTDLGVFDDPWTKEIIRQARLFGSRRLLNDFWIDRLRQLTSIPFILMPRLFVPQPGIEEIETLSDRMKAMEQHPYEPFL